MVFLVMMLMPMSLGGYSLTTPNISVKHARLQHAPETMITYIISITPSPERDRGNGPETRPGIKSQKQGDVTLNLPALVGALVLSRRGEGQNAKLF